MASAIEELRSAHEQLEVFEQAVYQHISKRPKTYTKTVLHENTLDRLLQGGKKATARILKLQADGDGALKEERGNMAGPAAFNTFYDRLRDIRDYHRKHSNVERADPYRQVRGRRGEGGAAEGRRGGRRGVQGSGRRRRGAPFR